MSTIKSSDEHLTLNADGSSKDIKFQANGVEKASLSSAGVMTATNFAANADDLEIRSSTGEKMIKCVKDAQVNLYYDNVKKFNTTSTGVTVTGSVDGADNLVEKVASGSTAALSHDGTASATVYAVTGTHTTYLVTASANSSITNVVALVSIGTSTSTMRITNLSGSYNTTVTGSGSNIQVTCAFGSSLVYQYRVIKLR
jgi:hypothetical protein